MKFLFAFLLLGVALCNELQPIASEASEDVIASNMDEGTYDEPNSEDLSMDEPQSVPDAEVDDLDEEQFTKLIGDEDSLLAMLANANPAHVAQGIALCKKMMAKNVADARKNVQQKAQLAKSAKQNAQAKQRLAKEKATLLRILRLFQGMKSGPQNLLGSAALKQRRPTKSAKIATNVTVGKEWRLSFQVYQWGKVGNWGSLIHFTTSGNGVRVPAIWFHGNSWKLHMCMATQRSTNDCWNSPAQLPGPRKWNSIVMMQKKDAQGKYWLSYFINGARKAKRSQTKPRVYKNLIVYSSDPWYASPKAYVRNLKMVNL
jgi:hypothetical protein